MSATEAQASHIQDRISQKFREEQAAFRALLPSLLPEYEGRFVAIHEGRLVDSGDDQIEVARRCYARFGYTPIYVGRVSSDPIGRARISSPRALRRTGDA